MHLSDIYSLTPFAPIYIAVVSVLQARFSEVRKQIKTYILTPINRKSLLSTIALSSMRGGDLSGLCLSH